MKTKTKKQYIKKADVRIGNFYVAKVSGKLTIVRITAGRGAELSSPWLVKDLNNRSFMLKSHMKLRLDLSALGFRYEPEADNKAVSDTHPKGS
jgi:hypothetical protein